MQLNQSQSFKESIKETATRKADFQEFEISETQERFRYFPNGRVEKIED